MTSRAKSRNSKVSGNKIPSLINGSAGRPVPGTAGKESGCRGCGAKIAKGQKCVDIPNPRKPFSNRKRFCPGCFTLVLEKTKADVVALAQA